MKKVLKTLSDIISVLTLIYAVYVLLTNDRSEFAFAIAILFANAMYLFASYKIYQEKKKQKDE